MTDQKRQHPTPWQVVKSILAAMIGVQSQEARERDFTHGNPVVYIAVGILFFVIFILVLVGVVKLVVS